MIITKLKFLKPLAYLILFVVCSSCSGTRNISRSFEKDQAFKQGFSGLVVFDPATNKVIYERNAEKYFTPASNVKLLTFYTGLKILGDSVPAFKYGVKNDTLIFKGTGDPSFLNPDLPNSKVFDFLKKSDKKLFFHPPVETEAFFGPGWSWDDYNSYYSVERTAFPVYGNRMNFSVSPGQNDFNVIPRVFRDSVKISNSKIPSERSLYFRREQGNNRVTYTTGSAPKMYEQDVPFKYSSELLVKILSDTLEQEVRILKDLPMNFSLNRELFSISADSLYKRMLEVSDNFIAEQILLLSAQRIADTLLAGIAIDHMKENFLKDLPDEVYWVDGSGLSRYNLVTPRSMVKLLSKIYKEVPQERLFNMLATGGKSGTLKNSYAAEEPYVFAKTGTLRNNHSLSGFLKAKSGKVLIFSFMNSNYTVPTSELKKQMEIILLELYKNN